MKILKDDEERLHLSFLIESIGLQQCQCIGKTFFVVK